MLFSVLPKMLLALCLQDLMISIFYILESTILYYDLFFVFLSLRFILGKVTAKECRDQISVDKPVSSDKVDKYPSF